MKTNIVSKCGPVFVAAAFVTTVEVVGMITLTILRAEIQFPFELFLIWFPIGVVLSCFVLLIFRPSLLSARDSLIQDESVSYALMIARLLSDEFSGLAKHIANAECELAAAAPKDSPPEERQIFSTKLREQMELVRDRAEKARNSITQLAIAAMHSIDVVQCKHCALVQVRLPDSICQHCRQRLPVRS